MEEFKLNLEKSIYQNLNRDKDLNKLFRPDKIGKCSMLFDKFKKTVEIQNKDTWKVFYLKQSNVMALKNIVDYIQDKHLLNFTDASDYMIYRVVGQTWNGMVNELRIIEKLKEKHPLFIFKKSDYETDQNYFTDIEVFFGQKLILGIQIKPISYKNMNTDYQIQAKKNHQEQAEKYKLKNKVNHLILFYNENTLQNYCDLKILLKKYL